MIEYIKGIIFTILFMIMLGSFGNSTHKSKNFSENLLYGYVYYTCIQFIGGFLAQQFHLPWIYFQVYMILLLISILSFIYYKKGFHMSKKDFFHHIKDYWLLYFLAFIFVGLSILNIQYQWNGNLVDDGYYLNKIRMAPYLDNYADYNYAAGYSAPGSIIRNVNTFEIEGAFFCQLLGMDASIYAKVFMAYFHYALVLHAIYWFYQVVTEKGKNKGILLSMLTVLFFGIYYEVMVNYHLLYLQDSWHFNTAMWYGSALVRCLGLFLLITPILKQNKLDKSTCFFFLCSCFMLFSKATQALPLIYLTLVAISFNFMLKNFKYRKIILYGLGLFVFVLFLLPVSDTVESRADVIMNQLCQNMATVIVRLSLFFMVLSYLFEIKTLRKWNNCLIIIAIFLFIPRLNSAFLMLSVYDFVAGRTVSLFFFALIITAFLDAYLILRTYVDNKKMILLIYTSLGFLLTMVPIISIQRNLGLINTINIIKNNPSLQPQSTLELGKALDEIAIETGKDLDVLMPMWAVLDGTPHAVSTMIRYNAISIHSIGAVPRYGSLFEDNEYYTYNNDVHVNFERFHSREIGDNSILENILRTYPSINCIVVYFDDAKDALETLSFKVIKRIPLSDGVHNYFIMMKDEVRENEN